MKRSITLAALLLCAVFGAARAQQAYDPAAAAERRRQMIDECQQNHGSEIDCTREVDTELRAEGLQSGARVIHLRPAR
jgi:hypothetical protein